MNPNIHIRRLQQWAKLVLEAENSGNKTVWCQENGIRYRQYLYWQKLVREYVLEHGENSLALEDSALPAAASETHQLVDVTPCLQDAEEKGLQTVPEETAGIQPELMVQYGDFHIYVGSSVTESTLATVLKAVRNA